jgi:hypothetical protein
VNIRQILFILPKLDALPINGLRDGFAELVATFSGLRARSMLCGDEAAFLY